EFAAALLPFADADTQKRYAVLGRAVATEEITIDRGAPAPADSETQATWDTDGARAVRVRRGLVVTGLAALGITLAVAGSAHWTRGPQPASATALTERDAPATSASVPAAERIAPSSVVAPSIALAPPTAPITADAPSAVTGPAASSASPTK